MTGRFWDHGPESTYFVHEEGIGIRATKLLRTYVTICHIMLTDLTPSG